MPNNSVFVEAPPERVFAYLSDLPRHKEWAADTVGPVALDPTPVGVGKRYQLNNHFQLGDVRDELEVTVFDPPRRFGFLARGAQDDLSHLFILSPLGGGTTVERVITVERAPFFLKQVVFPLAGLIFANASNTRSRSIS